jgi:hypothetical protein
MKQVSTGKLPGKVWKQEWKRQAAWTAGELAMLCCGWNPSGKIPNPGRRERTLQAIKRAVRVADPGLPIIDLRWPETRDEAFYSTAPLFAPTKVCAWAKAHYPDTFPYAVEDFIPERTAASSDGVTVVLPHLPRDLAKLLDVLRSHAGDVPYPAQREIALEIGEQLELKAEPTGDPNRVAETLARVIRPDRLAAADKRASKGRRA